MWRSILSKGFWLALAILLVLGGSIFAQDVSIPDTTPTETPIPTESPTEVPIETAALVPAVVVNEISPMQLAQGAGGMLTVSGANFTSSTTVMLNGTLALTITSQSDNTLTALVGSDVAAGVYSVVVSDPNGGAQTASTTLTVITPTSVPQLTISQTEPSQVTAGQSATLSILGTNFSTATTVRLVGFGFLTTTFVNSGALTGALPGSIPAGSYAIEVSDPSSGSAVAQGTFTVVALAATTIPVATATLTPTATAIPGQPRLVVNTFTAYPSSIYPGGTTQLAIEVYNVGSRTAEGVVISLGDSKFSPANGQASVTLPDLPSMTAYSVTLSVTAASDVAEGPQSIALVLTSRDFSGQTYSDNASVSVNVIATPEGEAQVVLDSYVLEPSTAAPGDTVTLRALFKNTGTETADQVLVQLDGTNGVLIAGTDGGSFAVGDMPAGAGAPVVMTFVVSSTASSGAQSQALAISYLQDGATKQGSASISLNVEVVTTPSPLLLLQSYSSGQAEALQPGQQFSFEMTLQNAGVVDVSNLLVTFKTVSTSTSGSSGSSSNATQSSPSTTTTTSSTDFTIYGSGGTVLLGDLTAGASVSLSQDFIVNSDLSSGVQDLPITLQYLDSEGTETQQTLSASLLVVVLPRLRVSAANTLDDPLTADEEYTLSLNIANLGDTQVLLTEMRATGDNVEISEGAEVTLDPLQSDDSATHSITFTPQAEGAYTVTVEVDYIDDLNRTQTITQAFSGQVEAAAQPVFQPRGAPPVQETVEDNSTRLGRLLLGFLGFGGDAMLYELASLSIHNLFRARARLVMTAGGVMIGTTAVVLLIALTIGLQTAAEASIGNGTSLTQITIRSSFRRDSSAPTLDMDAVEQLASLPDVTAVIPMLQLSGFVELRAGDLRGAAQIYGIYPATLSYLGVTAQDGILTLGDDDPYGAIIGGTVAGNFTSEDSDTFSSVSVDLISQSVEMRIYSQGSSTSRKVPFTINALLDTGSTWDSSILFPMQTVINLTERMTGEDLDADDLTFNQIIVQASSRETAASVLESITNLGFNASGTGSYLSQLNSFFGTLRVVLGGVGGVAMLVAAFGVANTMTMAILERTQEIGLMKAVGATDRAVLTIFLIEAGMVGLIGGTAGLTISYLLQSAGNQLLANLAATGALEGFLSVDLSTSSSTSLITIPNELAMFAVGLATCIGISAGLYPAMRAARTIPVLALKSD